ERRPKAERDRYRQLLRDEPDHRLALIEAGAEIEAQIVLQHYPEALRRRLVEAVELVELLDEIGAETARTAVLIGGGCGAAQLAAAAGDLAQARTLRAAQLGDELIDRPAWRRLHDHEIHEDDGKERRHHQQDAAQRVGEHRLGARWF